MQKIGKLRKAAAMLGATGTAVALGLAFAPGAAAATGASAPLVACTASFPIEVDGFAFTPATVIPGESATADLITTNCSALAVATTETWTGQWLPIAASGALPTGCPVIDPIARSVDYTPNEEVAVNQGYYVPVGCTAAGLAVTVRISAPPGTAGITATAILHILRPAG